MLLHNSAMHNSKGALVTVVKPEVRCGFRATIALYLHTVHKNCPVEVTYFSQLHHDIRRVSWLAGFEVLTAVVMKSIIFWDITRCSPLEVSRRFGGTCRLHLQGRRISQARNQREAGGKQIKMVETWSSKTSADFQRTTWGYTRIPQESIQVGLHLWRSGLESRPTINIPGWGFSTGSQGCTFAPKDHTRGYSYIRRMLIQSNQSWQNFSICMN
jgi:hypothetical protein